MPFFNADPLKVKMRQCVVGRLSFKDIPKSMFSNAEDMKLVKDLYDKLPLELQQLFIMSLILRVQAAKMSIVNAAFLLIEEKFVQTVALLPPQINVHEGMTARQIENLKRTSKSVGRAYLDGVLEPKKALEALEKLQKKHETYDGVLNDFIDMCLNCAKKSEYSNEERSLIALLLLLATKGAKPVLPDISEQNTRISTATKIAAYRAPAILVDVERAIGELQLKPAGSESDSILVAVKKLIAANVLIEMKIDQRYSQAIVELIKPNNKFVDEKVESILSQGVAEQTKSKLRTKNM